MRGKHLATIVLAVLTSCAPAAAQNLKKDFVELCDSLNLSVKRTMMMESALKIENVTRSGQTLTFRFSQELSDVNWSDRSLAWFRSEIIRLLPSKYDGCTVGKLFAKNVDVTTLATPELGSDGSAAAEYKYRVPDPRGRVRPMVTRVGAETYTQGLSGRYVALWQSHGRYYEAKERRWEWQRSQNHSTVEDMYTQSYVLPFLIPMLENAGAYVMTPRERDTQIYEVIVDNDPAFREERSGLVRRSGHFHTRGQWSQAGHGFADAKREYVLDDNPFTMGTALKSATATQEKGQRSEARWEFDVPESGYYSVYVSYASLPNSCEAARYTVSHTNGRTEFLVNQKLGGGTWTYLGHFHFHKGTHASVVLDNITDDRFAGSVVTADAVKIGGGMGKIARGPADAPVSTYTTSGMPCFTEGALYWEQFAGVDTTVTRNWETDYTQDYASRGAWVSMLTGGSAVNPSYEGPGKHIPVDLSLGFHTDAGITPSDSTVGTLSIYTLMADGSSKLPDGRSRELGRHLAGLVQDQVCADIRSEFSPLWSRRQLWNRNYSESRTTSVPGMLLELLSHQNFADMKFGLDPRFRFTVSRAVYKGMLKFLSDEYGVPYIVQPLPVRSMSADFTSDQEVRISWKATADTLEPTAVAKSFILQTRVGDGIFSEGVRLDDCRRDGDTWYATVGIEPDVTYSFRIIAENEGGRSFPSETVSVGRSSISKGTVLIVNNFDRVSAPTWFDTPTYAGFDLKSDGGVPYMSDISYIGEIHQFRRDKEWTDDDDPGFGATHSTDAGRTVAGNTFDYINTHGGDILAAGYSFFSASRDAFADGQAAGDYDVIDLICGKQVTTLTGDGSKPHCFEVFPASLREALRASAESGHSLIVSGAYIGTDAWDRVYPIEPDTESQKQTRDFIKNVLGYVWVTDQASYTAEVTPYSNPLLNLDGMGDFGYYSEKNSRMYCVESPDGIKPAGTHSATFLRYTGNNIPAAVAFEAVTHKSVSFGFPLETVRNAEIRSDLIRRCLEFFSSTNQ